MDIKSIGYIYFQKKSMSKASLLNRKFDNRFANSYVLGCLNFFLKFGHSLLFFNKRFTAKNKAKCLVYGPSINNRNTLVPVSNELGIENVVSFVNQKSLPLWKLYWYAIPHFFELLRDIKKALPDERPLYKLFFPKFWRMYGCEKFAFEMLDFYKPKVVLMANDHLELNRAILFACKDKGIKTIYAQHATSGCDFPPLQFDYSMLDGNDALKKYSNIGNIHGNVFLCGGVRFDPIAQTPVSRLSSFTIGIAINLVDSELMVKDFCLQIKGIKVNGKGPNIILRPHPQMDKEIWKKWCANNGIGFSASDNESSFHFCKRVHLLISNQCSIHLDSALCHTPSVVYNFSDQNVDDVYLFVKNGLTPVMSSMNDICKFIEGYENYTINEKAVKFYNYAYNTPYESKIAKLISDLIKAICEDQEQAFIKKCGFSIDNSTGVYNVYTYE